jgi:hypothetical protein
VRQTTRGCCAVSDREHQKRERQGAWREERVEWNIAFALG